MIVGKPEECIIYTGVNEWASKGDISFTNKIVEALLCKQRLLVGDAITHLGSQMGARIVGQEIIH